MRISCIYLHNRVDSPLPDGAYELVPRVEVKQEVPQQEEQPQQETVAPDQQIVNPSSAQAQGKPRSMNLYFQKYSQLCYYLCIRF
jgi:hypothetical protein